MNNPTETWHLSLNRASGRADVRKGKGDPKTRWAWGTKEEMVRCGLGHVSEVVVWDDGEKLLPRHVTMPEMASVDASE